MYGHPCAVVAHARALAPSAGAFWRWYQGRAVHGVLGLSQRVQVKSAVESQFETVVTKK